MIRENQRRNLFPNVSGAIPATSGNIPAGRQKELIKVINPIFALSNKNLSERP
jgi:hypothetical protein